MWLSVKLVLKEVEVFPRMTLRMWMSSFSRLQGFETSSVACKLLTLLNQSKILTNLLMLYSFVCQNLFGIRYMHHLMFFG